MLCSNRLHLSRGRRGFRVESRRPRGVALVAVMWIVAALSLLATSLAATTRADVQTAQGTRAFAEVAALGDAAIELAALAMRAKPPPVARRTQQAFEFDGRHVEVVMSPVGGFVSLNGASEALLRDLFMTGAGVERAVAETLAARVIDWRDSDVAALPMGAEDEAYEAAGVRFRTRGGSFESPEDLLQVLGVSFDIYDKIQSCLTVYGGSAGVDPLAASLDVLTILAGGARSRAEAIMVARDAGEPNIDMTALVQDHLAVSSGMIYRMEARVRDDRGRSLVRVRWVDLESPGRGGLPWRTLRVEAVRGVAESGAIDGV